VIPRILHRPVPPPIGLAAPRLPDRGTWPIFVSPHVDHDARDACHASLTLIVIRPWGPAQRDLDRALRAIRHLPEMNPFGH